MASSGWFCGLVCRKRELRRFTATVVVSRLSNVRVGIRVSIRVSLVLVIGLG